MKKLLVLFVALSVVLGFSACAAKKKKNNFISTECNMVCSKNECNQVCTTIEGTLK